MIFKCDEIPLKILSLNIKNVRKKTLQKEMCLQAF